MGTDGKPAETSTKGLTETGRGGGGVRGVRGGGLEEGG